MLNVCILYVVSKKDYSKLRKKFRVEMAGLGYKFGLSGREVDRYNPPRDGRYVVCSADLALYARRKWGNHQHQHTYIWDMRKRDDAVDVLLSADHPLSSGAHCLIWDGKEDLVYLLEEGDGTLGLPGGKIRSGETLEAALLREVFEETFRRLSMNTLVDGIWFSFPTDSHYDLVESEDVEIFGGLQEIHFYDRKQGVNCRTLLESECQADYFKHFESSGPRTAHCLFVDAEGARTASDLDWLKRSLVPVPLSSQDVRIRPYVRRILARIREKRVSYAEETFWCGFVDAQDDIEIYMDRPYKEVMDVFIYYAKWFHERGIPIPQFLTQFREDKFKELVAMSNAIVDSLIVSPF